MAKYGDVTADLERRLTIPLPRSLWDRITETAEMRGHSRTSIIRYMLEVFYDCLSDRPVRDVPYTDEEMRLAQRLTIRVPTSLFTMIARAAERAGITRTDVVLQNLHAWYEFFDGQADAKAEVRP